MKKRQVPSPREFASTLGQEPNELKKKLLLLGYMSNRLSDLGATLFLVGGQAVETYTGGVFNTGDIDITTTKDQATEELLGKLGFEKEGMIWINDKLGIAVHVVSSFPRRTLKSRTIEVNGYTVKVVGVEDLIVDRLAAAKFWRSERDEEQAKALLNAFEDSIDIAYLEGIAKEEMVEDFLERLRDRKRWPQRK